MLVLECLTGFARAVAVVPFALALRLVLSKRGHCTAGVGQSATTSRVGDNPSVRGSAGLIETIGA